MAKSRKGLGKKHGDDFKKNQVCDSKHRVYSGKGTDKDFDVVFSEFSKKNKTT